MAAVIGAGAAWKKVLELAHTAGVVVEVPTDVDIQLHRAREALLQQETLTRADLDARQAVLERRVADERASTARDVSFLNIRREHDLAGLRGLLRPVRAVFIRSQAQRLARRRMQPVVAAERALQDFVDGREGEVRRRVAAARTLLDKIESIAGSAELADAVAQLDLIDAFRALPDEYVLLNDVRFTSSRTIPAGEQADHLLIGPTGIHVITATGMGRLTGGTAPDAFDRARRAADVCRRLLAPAGYDRMIHGVVAYAGTAPRQALQDGVLAVPVERMPAYVQDGPALLSARDVERVRRLLAGDDAGTQIG